jgi:NitT/TauT family transport system substrate-binding protein
VFSLDDGANVTSAKQLEGLTLGSGSGSFTPKIIEGFLAQHGLDPRSLHVVDIAPQARASALLTKKVPAIEFFVMSKPGLEAGAKDINAQLRTFLLGDHGLELYSNGIGVREDYLTKNTDLVKRFVRAALQGWKFTFEHPDQAAQDLIKFVPSLKADVIKSEIEIVRNLAVTPDVEQHGLGWIDPAKVKTNLDFVVRYIGVNGTPPEAKDLYEGGFLPSPPAHQALKRSGPTCRMQLIGNRPAPLPRLADSERCIKYSRALVRRHSLRSVPFRSISRRASL